VGDRGRSGIGAGNGIFDTFQGSAALTDEGSEARLVAKIRATIISLLNVRRLFLFCSSMGFSGSRAECRSFKIYAQKAFNLRPFN